MKDFKELGLDDQTLKAITFDKPTEIQEKTIPLVLQGKDIIAGNDKILHKFDIPHDNKFLHMLIFISEP
jgi:hypothetical protein